MTIDSIDELCTILHHCGFSGLSLWKCDNPACKMWHSCVYRIGQNQQFEPFDGKSATPEGAFRQTIEKLQDWLKLNPDKLR